MSVAFLTERFAFSFGVLAKAPVNFLSSVLRMCESDVDVADETEDDLGLMLAGMTGQQFFGPDQD